ncbi:MAG: DUF192 domain-containing protein [Candidatus Harrisonbacteria bacterium]|nr:DUF192 domain-containing protein [Candidatus Harrisonbacteria bacterium]
MLKKIFVSLGLFTVVVVLGGLYGLLLGNRDRREEFKTLIIGTNKFEIEIADNALEQAHGLSGRDFLADDRGMLFVFADLSVRSFWMAGMKFPLDIIWIKGDKVVGFSENLPLASAANVKIYYSPESIDKVLEINAGLVNKLGIRAGDVIGFDQ